MNSLPKTVTRQRRGCDLNPGPTAPESSTLITRLSNHPYRLRVKTLLFEYGVGDRATYGRRRQRGRRLNEPARKRRVAGASATCTCNTRHKYRLLLIAWSLEPENSTASHLRCGNFTGYQSGKGSDLRQTFWSTSASMDWLQNICLSTAS